MARVTVWLLLFFVFMNGGAGMMQATGVAATIGINADVGAPSELEQTRQDAQSVSTSGGFGSTLYGLYQSVGTTLAGFFGAVAPAVSMLTNIGVPSPIMGYLSTAVSIVIALDLLSTLLGSGDII